MKTHVLKHIRFSASAVSLIQTDILNILGISFSQYLQNYVINEANRLLNDRDKQGLLKKSAMQLVEEAGTEEEYQAALSLFEKELLEE